jgi:hypothetical protein
MSQPMLDKSLEGHWVHSHEEDTPSSMVFRPADYAFPRSRGRSGFRLEPGGKAIEYGIGPTDRTAEAECSWHLEQLDEPTVILDNPSGIPRRLPIASLSDGRLVIKRES